MSWQWLAMITPCVNALRELAKTMNNALGYDQGSKHTSVDPINDIHCIMESLSDRGTYDLTIGRVLEDDQEVTDAISFGLHNMISGTSSPLHEFNNAFSRLQRQRRMIPVDINTDNLLPVTSPSTTSLNAPLSTTANTPTPTTPPPHTQVPTPDSEMVDDDESPGELETLLMELESGQGEPTLQLTTSEDVSLDFDDETLYNQTDDFLDESHADLEEEEPIEVEGESDIFDRGW